MATRSTDGRVAAQRETPAHALSTEERQQILTVANSAEFASLPPSQIVPTLADRDVYLASESTFYRVLRQAGQQPSRSGTGAEKKASEQPLCNRTIRSGRGI